MAYREEMKIKMAREIQIEAERCRWSWNPKRFFCTIGCHMKLGKCSDTRRVTTPQVQLSSADVEQDVVASIAVAALTFVIIFVLLVRRCLLHRESTRKEKRKKPLQIELWPGKAHPCMRIFLPLSNSESSRPRAAFVVFRGGGWYSCMGSGEGTAEWAADHGLVGVEVEYAAKIGAEPLSGAAAPAGSVLGPLPDGEAAYPQCLADSCRAVRLLRKLGKDGSLPVDPSRVAVCGFSAGGHLAGLLATLHGTHLTCNPHDDLAWDFSCRPDRAVLCYAVTTLTNPNDPEKLSNAYVNVLGTSGYQDARLRAQLSPALHVSESTPPLFIWCTADDPLVPSDHSTKMYEAARSHGVSAELHIYADPIKGGVHAQGLADGNSSLVGWSDQCLAWLGPNWL